jgi:hypothetical protein
MGRSAGGQIAETVAVTGTQPGVIGCIALYAPADMNFAYQYANKKDILNSDKLLRQYLGGTPSRGKGELRQRFPVQPGQREVTAHAPHSWRQR